MEIVIRLGQYHQLEARHVDAVYYLSSSAGDFVQVIPRGLCVINASAKRMS